MTEEQMHQAGLEAICTFRTLLMGCQLCVSDVADLGDQTALVYMAAIAKVKVVQ